MIDERLAGVPVVDEQPVEPLLLQTTRSWMLAGPSCVHVRSGPPPAAKAIVA